MNGIMIVLTLLSVIILSNMSCAYYRIMGSYPAHINKVKGKVSWHYDYFLAIGAFIVKSSSKVKIVRFISCRSTHFVTSNYIIIVGANSSPAG